MITVISLWILVVLSVFSVAVGSRARFTLDAGRYELAKTKSYRLARSGVVLARRVLDSDLTPDLDNLFEYRTEDRGVFEKIQQREGWFNVTYSYTQGTGPWREPVYGIEDENGKININYASRRTLARLPGVGEEIADCIIDWRDSNEKTSPRGAEQEYYVNNSLPYNCADRLFSCMEELLMVKGIDAELLESLRPFITVYGDSAVNVLTAPAEVLKAVGLPESLVGKIIAIQNNKNFFDSFPGDGPPEVDVFLQLVRETTGAKQNEQVMLRSYFFLGRLKFDSNIFRFRSKGVIPIGDTSGEVGNATTTVIEVVYERPSGKTAVKAESPRSGVIYSGGKIDATCGRKL